MDTMSTTWSLGGIFDGEAKLKGRCKNCWGRLIGRTDDNSAWTGIKCRVCGQVLEGLDAKKEEQRILTESTSNMLKVTYGKPSEYAEGQFVIKVIPETDRVAPSELNKWIKTKSAKKSSRLTRKDFPVGSPGYLLLQATAIVAGLESIFDANGESVMEFPEARLNDDGSWTMRMDVQGLIDDPQHPGYGLKVRVGTTAITFMMAAFACELLMKAICLTCVGEAAKSHDLLELFKDLPDESRLRLEADHPGVGNFLSSNRHVFGSQRYLSGNAKKNAVNAMINPMGANDMCRIARVLLDEAETMGLSCGLTINAKRATRDMGNRMLIKQKLNISAKAGESPPRRLLRSARR